MTERDLAMFCDWTTVVSLVLMVVWLLRISRTGRRALFMAMACFDFAVLAQLVKFSAPVWAIVLFALSLLSMLVLDFGMRSAERRDVL